MLRKYAYIFENDLQNAKNEYCEGTKLLQLNGVLFDKLVPRLIADKPETAAGVTLRDVNRRLQRTLNDGDVFKTIANYGYDYDIGYVDDYSANIEALYNYLNDILVKVIRSRAGKAALVGTEFEYLINLAK